MQSVCKYTGLSAASVEYLNTVKPVARPFVTRLVNDFLLSEVFVETLEELVFKSAQALTIAKWSKTSAQEALGLIHNRIKFLEHSDAGGYLISADEAADLYSRQALDKTTERISSILEVVRAELSKIISESPAAEPDEIISEWSKKLDEYHLEYVQNKLG